jgi:phage gp29-like protein
VSTTVTTKALYTPETFSLADKWREMFNPLDWLTLRQISAWLYLQQLGAHADITWLYEFIERRHPTLAACVHRRLSAMEKLDWDVLTTPEEELPEGCSMQDAEVQQQLLLDDYNAIDNMEEAIEWMALADFRGFAHLEQHWADNQVVHLQPVPQWNMARAQKYGAWFYNQRAMPVYPSPGAGLPGQLKPIDAANFIIREVRQPIDELAIFCAWRCIQAQKDFDGFIATFGIPPIFLIQPEGIPAEQAKEYQETAEQIVNDARGTLPHGSDVKTVESHAGGHPFLDYLKYQNEQIVLAATGGKLTMMTESGSGTLAGKAHKDTFDEIAEANAVSITRVFNMQFDRPRLAAKFPNKPILARFVLQGTEQSDKAQVVRDIAQLAAAGKSMNNQQVEDLTGYEVTDQIPVSKTADTAFADDPKGQPTYNNRGGDPEADKVLKAALSGLTVAQARALRPLLLELKDAATVGDDELLRNRCLEMADRMPQLLIAMKVDDGRAQVITKGLVAEYWNGRLEKTGAKA